MTELKQTKFESSIIRLKEQMLGMKGTNSYLQLSDNDKQEFDKLIESLPKTSEEDEDFSIDVLIPSILNILKSLNHFLIH